MSSIKDGMVKESEIFQPVNFPLMVSELAAIKNGLALVPVYFKADIIISYLKNHSIKSDWIAFNPNLTKLITSGTFITTHIEAIFVKYGKYKIFLGDFESYIRMQILN